MKLKTMLAMAAVAVTASAFAQAQTVREVSFKNGYVEVKGNLYLPPKFDEKKQYKAVVVSHPGGGVKEQAAGTYAERLSAEGLVTLAYDASYQGASGGEPRGVEDPFTRVEDVRCAVDYLTTLPYIDRNGIGALGICAGGGITIKAACIEKRIKAVAGVSIFEVGRDLFPKDAVLAMLKSDAEIRTAEANGEPLHYTTYIPDSQADLTGNEPVFIKEAVDYYRTPRAQHPNATNRHLVRGNDRLVMFSAFDQVPDLLDQPLLLISGEKSDTHHFSQKVYDLVQCKKEMYRVKGATHVSLYDDEKQVADAVKKLAKFYKKYL